MFRICYFIIQFILSFEAICQQRIVFADSVNKVPVSGIYVFGDKSTYYTDSTGTIQINYSLEEKLLVKHPNYETKFISKPFPDTLFLKYQPYQTKEIGFEVKKWYKKSAGKREINQLYSTIIFTRANLNGRAYNKLIIPITKRKTKRIPKGNYLMVELREPNYLYFDTAEIFKRMPFDDKLKLSKYPTLSIPGDRIKLFRYPVESLSNSDLEIDLSDISNKYNEMFVSLYWLVEESSQLPTRRQFKFLKSMKVGAKDVITFDTTGKYPPMPFFYHCLLTDELSEEELQTIDCLAPASISNEKAVFRLFAPVALAFSRPASHRVKLKKAE